MGMGHSASFAEVIEQSFVKEICPETFQKFIDAIDEADKTLEEFARDDSNFDFEPFQELLKDFKKKTKLDMYLAYHDQENSGDRYDEVDGVYWALDFSDVYEMTPAAKKLAAKINRKFFVNFG
jgi:hypothetical protein